MARRTRGEVINLSGVHLGKRRNISLYDELHVVLTDAVCAWAGVPVASWELEQRARQLARLFDRAGAKGIGHVRARIARKQAEQWISAWVKKRRRRGRLPGPMTPADAVVWHRDLNDRLLPPGVAAVEILNVLRPTVAVSVYILYCAHALQIYPECKERISLGDKKFLEAFVQEVRRHYPFFPSIIAKAKKDFTWRGVRFRKGMRALLDIYATNHDTASWSSPDTFDPERFLRGENNAFNFIPQGGGEHGVHHRCAGEWVTIELMKFATQFLATRMTYAVRNADAFALEAHASGFSRPNGDRRCKASGTNYKA